MKYYLLLIASALSLGSITFYLFTQPKNIVEHRKAASIKAAFEYNIKMTKDPALGYPPKGRWYDAVQQTKALQKQFYTQKNNITKAIWRERGPYNVGGRTRSLLVDVADSSRNTLLAGGVAGGLWKTTNIDAEEPTWFSISDELENLAVGAIAQAASQPNILYIGTGEGYPNVDAVDGIGIFKSVDSGETWTLLPATANNENFQIVRTLLTTPNNSEEVYAGTNKGLFRTLDGGNNWELVLGDGAIAPSIYDMQLAENGLFASNANNIFYSETGDKNTWTTLIDTESELTNGWTRLEFTICNQNPNVMYFVGSRSGNVTPIYTTTDGGQSWQATGSPNEVHGGDFTNGQSWYDLDIAVDPFDCSHVIAGGVPIFKSQDSGATWVEFATNMHVDQHRILFDDLQKDMIYFGNDGGVWRSTTGSSEEVEDKNFGYNTTQFYACAWHPDTLSNYILGGTQDNNSLQLNEFKAAKARSVLGGDGFYCHIDTDEPHIQMVSYQFGNYSVSTNGGRSFRSAFEANGTFFTPTDYDNSSNTLYGQTNDAGYFRYNLNSETYSTVRFKGNPNYDITAVTVDPNTPNRVYFGTDKGQILLVEQAQRGSIKSERILADFRGAISSIDIEIGNPNHLIITQSNYGLADNILESTNGGRNWTNVEGTTLPDVPVRWAIFNPSNSEQALIATEVGVWLTNKLDGENTVWIPPLPISQGGIPMTRVDMLQVRTSDNMVLAATHGRGMFTTDVFSTARAVALHHPVNYADAPITFEGALSLRPEQYAWDLGDGTTSKEATITHVYPNVGTYPIQFILNDSLMLNSQLQILPNLPLPYTSEANAYDGGFETNPTQYASHTVSGSGFERGKSDILGKNGTKSGDNAVVIEMDSATYAPNSEAYLYLPNFDFSLTSIYNFSFWAKYDLQDSLDGFLIEYSTDRGDTWEVLGTTADKNWYNIMLNRPEYEEEQEEEDDNYLDNYLDNLTRLRSAAFNLDVPFFSGKQEDWTNYQLNISDFSGESNVAFRFVFKSESTGTNSGLAIDDVTITRYDGELATKIISASITTDNSNRATINWQTQPEYYCQYFEIERSNNGRDFTKLATVKAASISDQILNYSKTVEYSEQTPFFRVKGFSGKETITDTTTSQLLIIPLTTTNTGTIHRIFPSPFQDHIGVTYNQLINKRVQFQLFDAAGRLVFEAQQIPNTVYQRLEVGQQTAGMYYLRVQVEGQEEEVFPVIAQ